MNTTISTWMLAGALAVSLAWNARGLFSTPAVSAMPVCIGAPALDQLDLSAEQQSALEAWQKNSCEPSCRIDRDVETKLGELHAALSGGTATPESLRALAAEISRMRARSLEVCVDSILEVRRVLTRDQLGALMQCCDSSACSK